MKSLLFLLLHVVGLLGIRAGVCEVNYRVLGGEYANKEEFPGMVYLEKVNESMIYSCAGSLISNRWVLTAGHCVNLEAGHFFYIRVYPTKGYDSYIQSSDVIVHEDNDHSTEDKDIGLIRLPVSMARIDPFFKTAPLPAQGQPLTSNEITLVGWGVSSTTDPKANPPYLMKKEHVPLNQTICRIAGYNPSETLCFYPTLATGTLCPGDSGGPIYMDGLMVGIVSHSAIIDSDYTGHFDVRVSGFRNWIDAKIRSYEAVLETLLE